MTMYEHYLQPNDSHKSFYRKAVMTWDEHGNVFLKSYNTTVARYSPIDRKIHRLWEGYSATTQRHIVAFCAHLGLPAIHKSEWEDMPVESL